MKPFKNPLAPRSLNLKAKSDEIKTWVRQIKSLSEGTTVTIAELACRDEGCPDIETVIGILEPGIPIKTIRVHCPLKEVTQEAIVVATAELL